jgi:putative methionine-R-sulfoxide reductase with GAF domain
MENDHCLAVFDIDSDNHAAFDEIDKKYTEKICQLLARQHSIFSQL